jgi:hypothetical protein
MGNVVQLNETRETKETLEVPFTPNIRYAHIRANRHTSNGGGITVVFYQEGPHVKFSLACCNPKDHFVKKIGRCRALAAMENGEVTTVSTSTIKALNPHLRFKYPKDVIYALFGQI